MKAKEIELVVYEPNLTEAAFFHSKTMTNLAEFKASCDVILANRRVAELDDVIDKLYTRDLFGSD